MEPRLLLTGNPSISGLQGVAVTPVGGDIARNSSLHDYDRVATTVDWGDGSPIQSITAILDRLGTSSENTLSIDLFGNGHVYSQAGTFPIHLTYTLPDGTSGILDWDAQIQHFELSGVTQTVKVGESIASSTLASIDLHGQDFKPGDFTATIDWNDGATPTTATITHKSIPGPGLGDIPTEILAVSDSRTFSEVGLKSFTVTMTDAAGESHVWHGWLDVSADAAPVPQPQVNTLTGVQGMLMGVSLGRIVKAPWMSDYGRYPVTIDWGDGSAPESATAILIVPNGTDGTVVEVSLIAIGHIYAQGGTYPIVATLSGPSGQSLALSTTAVIDHFQVSGTPLDGETGVPLGPDPIGYLQTPGETPDPSEFTATVDWGDGSATEAGTLVASPLPTAPGIPTLYGLAITNAHTYATAQGYPITVTITDSHGETHTLHQFALIVAGMAADSSQAPPATTSTSAPASSTPPAPGTRDPIHGRGQKATPSEAANKIKGAKAYAARKHLERVLAAKHRHELALAARNHLKLGA